MTDQVAHQHWWKHFRSSKTNAGTVPSSTEHDAEVWRKRPDANGEAPLATARPLDDASGPPFDPAAPHSLQPWNQDVLDRIAQAYDLGGPLEWAPGSDESSGTKLRLRAGESNYVLHVIGSDDAGALALAAEIDLVRFLAEQYFPVATVVKTRAGADYLRTHAAFHMITATEPANAFDRGNQTHRLEAAAGLAQFHQLVRDYQGALPLGPSQFLTDSLQCEAHWIDENAHEFETRRFGRWAGLADSLLSARDELVSLAEWISEVYRREPKILVHGAYDQSAVTFDGLGLAEVVNFNQIGYDTRLADLSRSLMAFCSLHGEPGKGGDDLNAVWFREFLSTYEQESPLSDLEAQTLPFFVRAHHLIWVVEDCRRLLQAAEQEDNEPTIDELEAESFCLSLRLGRVTRPPPAAKSPGSGARETRNQRP